MLYIAPDGEGPGPAGVIRVAFLNDIKAIQQKFGTIPSLPLR